MGLRQDLERLAADPAAFLAAPDPALRRLAVAALDDPADAEHVGRLAVADPDPGVRAGAAETLGRLGGETARVALRVARADSDPRVVEAVATAYGEIGDPDAVPWLEDAARTHPDRLVREAAVAALGAIGDERSVPVLIDLLTDAPPQVRRRCVVALSVFDGPHVEEAIRRAARDRNPAVREAAQMLTGIPD